MLEPHVRVTSQINYGDVTMNNDFFGHEWGDLRMIFTSDERVKIIGKSPYSWPKNLYSRELIILYIMHIITQKKSNESENMYINFAFFDNVIYGSSWSMQIKITWGPFHEWFFDRNLNSTENCF